MSQRVTRRCHIVYLQDLLIILLRHMTVSSSS